MATTGGWTEEHVTALGDPVAVGELADAGSWRGVGHDGDVVWGFCLGAHGRSADRGYDVIVDLLSFDALRIDGSGRDAVTARCTCPSRKRPCKHALALLLRHVRGDVPFAERPAKVERLVGAIRRPTDTCTDPHRPDSEPSPAAPTDRPSDRHTSGSTGDDRMARAAQGLADLGRWSEDRIRTGLADPALARYETWDRLAARLVDAGAGALAGRVRRIAGLVGVGSDWHERVLAELGILHLLVSGGVHFPMLPDALADVLAPAIGRQVRSAEVLGGVPETDVWLVAGRSDTREDRIVVRRWWLFGTTTGRWAMVLSFAARGEALEDSFVVGETITADLHRYPGRSLRALVGRRNVSELSDQVDPGRHGGGSVADACVSIGGMVAAEPWIERAPMTVVAAPTRSERGWVLTDATGSLPLLGVDRQIAALLAVSSGRPVATTAEWTPWGVRPLAVHLDDRSLDLGPTDRDQDGHGSGSLDASRPGVGPGGVLDRYWQDLVAVAVLGTERREPPRPPPGPLADLLADRSVEPSIARSDGGATRRAIDAAAGMLAAVAAVTAVRRGAFMAGPCLDRLAPPDDDDRPSCPADVVATWRSIVRDWPVLEDEWLMRLAVSGLVPPADLVVDLLRRHRASVDRFDLVVRAGGPLVPWLVDLVPSLAGPGARRSRPATTSPGPVGLPDLPMPADLARLVASAPDEFIDGLVALLASPPGPSSRGPFLANVLARCHPDVLVDAIEVLERSGHPLVGLVRLRRRMLDELAGQPSAPR